jgi:hypothetical protein
MIKRENQDDESIENKNGIKKYFYEFLEEIKVDLHHLLESKYGSFILRTLFETLLHENLVKKIFKKN